jgi:cell division transport system permease protein
MILSEAVRSITANLSTTVAATMTVLIGMFLLGLVIALGTWVLAFSDRTQDRLVVNVYFCTSYTCPQRGEAGRVQIDRVHEQLRVMPEVRRVEFISKEEALEIMKERTPELARNVGQNPLPHALKVRAVRAEEIPTIAKRIEAAKYPGVQKVNYGEETTKRVIQAATVISSIFLIAVIVLVAASTLLIANTIRLSIFARRREIEVMKLVGATNWFVRGPFMIEGLICGVTGSLVAVFLLLLGREVALPRILENADYSGVGAIGFFWNALILLAIGLLLGALGSGLTLRRFLRV